MKAKKNKPQTSAPKKATSDEGHGQAGHFGSDGDLGTHRNVSPNRSSPANSESDTRERENKTQR